MPGNLNLENKLLPIPNGIAPNINLTIPNAIAPKPNAAAILPAANITSGAAIAATIIPPRLFLIASAGLTPSTNISNNVLIAKVLLTPPNIFLKGPNAFCSKPVFAAPAVAPAVAPAAPEAAGFLPKASANFLN